MESHLLKLTHRVLFIILLTGLTLTLTKPSLSFAQISNAELKGNLTCLWGDSDCNPCVNNVLDNFQNISNNNGDHTGHISLFIDALDYSESPERIMNDLNDEWHVQGMARLPYRDREKNWFIFSRSEHSTPASLFVGQMGEITSAGGNLGTYLDIGNNSNEVKALFDMDQFFPNPASTQNHYGGLQAVGHFIFVGAECHKNSYNCGYDQAVHIYNFSDPLNPVAAGYLSMEGLSDKIGTVAATKLQNGHYLMMVPDENGNQYFFTSDSPNLNIETSWNLREYWHNSEVIDGGLESVDGIWGGYQNINFVNECGTGDIYLIGSTRHITNLCYVFGGCKSWLDLFQLTSNGNSEIEITKIDHSRMHCDTCDMAASGNLYITPEKNMTFYSSEKGAWYFLGFEEYQNAFNQCNGAQDLECDYDEDDLDNDQEDQYGSSRYNPDTDNDGVNDGDEVLMGRNPLVNENIIITPILKLLLLS